MLIGLQKAVINSELQNAVKSRKKKNQVRNDGWMPTPGNSKVIKMKVSDLEKAHEMTIDLRDKIDDYKRLISGIGLHMSIGSKGIDKSLVNAIRPAVLTEFQRRIEEIKEELAALGVDADELG